jgi:D-lyxose ketol-isomerase
MKKQTTDWRKFRKSTHLASADLDIMQSEGKSLIFNIKEVRYEQTVNVSGTKMDGFFCYFKEHIKALKLNTSNLLVLSSFVKAKVISINDIYVVEKYKDLVIELFVDRNVKFMGDTVDGVRIRSVQPILTKQDLTPKHARWDAAKKAVKEGKEKGVLSQFNVSTENLELLRK